jgi:hypothetical protein
VSDQRLTRMSAIAWGLRGLGMATGDALVSAAHLENAEHPGDPPRWHYLTCEEGLPYAPHPGHRCKETA